MAVVRRPRLFFSYPAGSSGPHNPGGMSLVQKSNILLFGVFSFHGILSPSDVKQRVATH